MPRRRLLLLFALLGALPPLEARAGWTPARTAPVAFPISPAVALGSRGRGTLLTADEATPARLLESRVREGRPTPLTPLLSAPFVLESATDGRGGLAALTPAADGNLQLSVRDRGGALQPPVGLTPPTSVGRLAMNARGDVAVAYQTQTEVLLVVRLRGQAPSAPVVLSAPATSITLSAVDLDERGDVAVGWSRDGVAEARVRGATGALSPVAVLSAPGETPAGVVAVIDDRGVATAASVGVVSASPDGAGLLRAATRAPGGEWEGTVSLDARASGSTLSAAAAGRHTVLAWSAPSATAPAGAPGAVRAAVRSGRTLRRTGVPVVTAGAASTGEIAAAVAPDGGAVLLSQVGAAIRAHVRRPGGRAFRTPRVLSTITGGALRSEKSVAAGPGGRALTTWAVDTGLQLRSLANRARERTPRARRSPPRTSATPLVLDLRNGGAVVRTAVRCNVPCRISLTARLRTTSSFVNVRRVRTLDRAGRTVVVDRLNPAEVRRVRSAQAAGRLDSSLPATLIVASRSGASVQRERPIGLLGP